jgi:hypothetical protein
MDFFRESLRLQLIGELPELVEIDTRPEPKRMGNRLWGGMASGRGIFTHAGTNCSIDRFLKRNAKLPRTLFQQSREIIVERQSRSHSGIIDASSVDVKTSTCPGSPRFEISRPRTRIT